MLVLILVILKALIMGTNKQIAAESRLGTIGRFALMGAGNPL